MAACPHIATCALTRNVPVAGALRVWQSFYCEDAFARCERYKLASAGRAIPDKLLPNGRLRDPFEDGAAVAASHRR